MAPGHILAAILALFAVFTCGFLQVDLKRPNVDAWRLVPESWTPYLYAVCSRLCYTCRGVLSKRWQILSALREKGRIAAHEALVHAKRIRAREESEIGLEDEVACEANSMTQNYKHLAMATGAGPLTDEEGALAHLLAHPYPKNEEKDAKLKVDMSKLSTEIYMTKFDLMVSRATNAFEVFG